MKNRKQKTQAGKCFQCDKTKGKVNYTTEKAADRARTLAWANNPSANFNEFKDLHSYKCPHSKYYHVGHYSYYIKSVSNLQGVDVQNQPVAGRV